MNLILDCFFPVSIPKLKFFKEIIDKIAAWTKPFRWSQIQAQISGLCIPYMLLWSGYWNNNSLPSSLPQSSLCKENSLWQDKSSKGTILRQSDSTLTKILLLGDSKLDLETNKILLMSTIEFI